MTSRYQTLLIRTKDKLAKYQSIVKLQSEFDEEADDFDKWLATTDEKFAMYTLPENIDAENAQVRYSTVHLSYRFNVFELWNLLGKMFHF